MLTLLTKLEKNAIAIYKKKELTPADLQEIQQFVILCLYCGKYIPPRRSQDYFNFKFKEINKFKNLTFHEISKNLRVRCQIEKKT